MSSAVPNEASQEAARRGEELLDRLRKAVKNKRLVIIVGAGVTLNATSDTLGKPLPRLTWTGLIRNGLDYLVNGSYVNAANRRTAQAYSSLEHDDPDSLLDAANIMASQMRQNGQLPTWLESVFGSLYSEVRHQAVLEALQALHKSGATLLTTNHDDILEKACSLRHIGRSNRNEILKFKRGDLDGVFHIHGSYHEPQEVVLDTTDYYQVTHSDEVQNLLKAFLEFNTILFVGCGSELEDPNFSTLLKWASERQENIPNRHCLLVRDGDSLNHKLLVLVKYGSEYEDLGSYLKRLLDQPCQATQDSMTTRAATTSSTPDSIRIIVPLLRNPDYVERKTIFDELDRRLFSNNQTHRKAALCGLGGVGKTQIALEYVYRLMKKPPLRSIFWVYASSVARFEEAYQRIARECQIPGHQDPKADQMQLVRDWLEAKHDLPWLMIIDNVDDDQVIFGKIASGKCLLEYVPQSSQGFVIYTTRNRDIGVDLVGDPIDVSVMDLAEAQTLLHKKLATSVTPMEEQEFLEEMGYLPIAVTQAASFMSKRRISISQYLTLFRQSDTNRTKLISHQFTDHGRESRPMESAAKTWMVSFQYIKGQNTRASDILTVMSFLDRNAIPNPLLVNDNEEQLDFLEAMTLLEAFSLVHRKTDSDIHDMHRLVQLATRAWIREDGDEDRWAFLALLILSKRFPYGDYEHWKTCAIYFPHADMILRYDFHEQRNEVSAAQATLLSNMSRYLREQGSYDTSVEKAKKSVKLREEVLGPEHPETLTSLDNLARALESQGDFRSAEIFARKTLRARERLLGQEHEDSLGSSETLARVLFRKGEYDAAEHLSRLVVAGRTKVLGPEHRHTLSMILFTGWMLHYQSKYESAKAQISQALSLQKKTLGDDHPDTLESLGRLAITELKLGDAGRAESLLQDALSKAQQVFGEEHPKTYTIMGSLAMVLSTKFQYEEAETLNRKCLQWKETILGNHHPETLMTLHNLALDLSNQGKHDQAEGILRQTLKKEEEVLGQKHPEILTSMSNLARVLRNQGKYSEAEKLHRQTLKEREEVLGQKHLDTLRSMNDLARVLRNQGKYSEAEDLHQQTLKGREEILGQKHPDTLRSMHHLASILRKQGKYSEAEELYRGNKEELEEQVTEEASDL